jgi:hypothetical protein
MLLLLLAWFACLLVSSPVDGCNGNGKCETSQPSVPMDKSSVSDSASPGSSRCGRECRYFMWTQWSVCTCGSQRRSRVASSSSLGTECARNFCPRLQTRKCSEHCKMSDWSHWSSCVNGAQERRRTIVVPETCRSTDDVHVRVSCQKDLVERRSCERTSYTYDHEQLGHNVKRSISDGMVDC